MSVFPRDRFPFKVDIFSGKSWYEIAEFETVRAAEYFIIIGPHAYVERIRFCCPVAFPEGEDLL